VQITARPGRGVTADPPAILASDRHHGVAPGRANREDERSLRRILDGMGVSSRRDSEQVVEPGPGPLSGSGVVRDHEQDVAVGGGAGPGHARGEVPHAVPDACGLALGVRRTVKPVRRSDATH
jgi:hypothetical protein